MTRRNIELILLCIAAPLVVLLFAMLAINQGQNLNVNTLGVPLGLFGAFVIAHLAIRKFAPGGDPAILPIVFALSGTGVAFVTRLAPKLAFGQVFWLFVSVACMIVVLAVVRNLDKVANYKYTLMIAGIVLLFSPLLPFFGQEINGGRIWVHIGSYSFQPGELAKIAIVLFLASYLAANREMLSIFTWRLGPLHLPDIRVIIPLLVMWLMALVIVVFEKDLGSAFVLFFVFIIMLYVASGKKSFLIVGLVLVVALAIGAYYGFGHVRLRVNIWLNPFVDPSNTSFQLVQSLYSFADGGLFGQGVGRGLASIIPIVESDFIFSDIAEELGLLGAAGILLLFLGLCIRGFITAARAKSDVSSFVAVGLITTFALQTFVIVGGVSGLIPLTGITLPFISQGGSSLMASFIAVAFLLRCGDEGTGVGKEMTSAITTAVNVNGVLGRVSLGKRLTRSTIMFSCLFALLVGNLTWLMVIHADEYKNMPGNNHTLMRQAKIQRGTISTYDGAVLAQSKKQADDTYDREYPSGDLASQVTGYYSPRFGTSGIESSENDALRGQNNFASWTDVLNDMAGISTPGNDVSLTINSKIQKAAQSALEGEKGACVVLDPTTGAVLAMASAPTYNANDIEKLLEDTGNGSSGNDGSLLNRAIQTPYTPGSTFKMITLATAFEDNIADEKTTFSAPGTMLIGGANISNFDHNNYGNISLARATELSSNTAFGQLGVKMGKQKLVEGAEKFGFDHPIKFDLNTLTSTIGEADDSNDWRTAWAAAGESMDNQGPSTTVLQMACVGAAIANGGTMMSPYLIDGIYSANGERSYTAQPNEFLQAISKTTADRVKKVLEGVVKNGTGTGAAISGVSVAGKTGTHEKANTNDSWFVGMAPSDNPRAVVALVLEDAKEGAATTKAQNVLKTALDVQGLD